MNSVLFAIKPEYIDLILDGCKKYEFRKRQIRKFGISVAYLYCTSPVQKVVAKANIAKIICNDPLSVWAQTSQYAGISFQDYMKYFQNNSYAVAYELSKIEIIQFPFDVTVFNLSRPPQSFCYVDDIHISR